MARGPLYSKRHSEQHTTMGRPCGENPTPHRPALGHYAKRLRVAG